MKKAITTLIGAAVFALTIVGNSTAWAGSRYNSEVTVNGTSAKGGMVGARYSSDTTQYIGCTQSVHSVSGISIRCYAKNKNGVFFSCTSTDPKFFDVLQTMTDFSYIEFLTPDGYGGLPCSYIRVENPSYYKPESTGKN
jgi:hypothetical protein